MVEVEMQSCLRSQKLFVEYAGKVSRGFEWRREGGREGDEIRDLIKIR